MGESDRKVYILINGPSYLIIELGGYTVELALNGTEGRNRTDTTCVTGF